jgi:hypothetical protein
MILMFCLKFHIFILTLFRNKYFLVYYVELQYIVK